MNEQQVQAKTKRVDRLVSNRYYLVAAQKLLLGASWSSAKPGDLIRSPKQRPLSFCSLDGALKWRRERVEQNRHAFIRVVPGFDVRTISAEIKHNADQFAARTAQVSP